MKASIPLRVVYERLKNTVEGDSEMNTESLGMANELLRLVIGVEGLESIAENRDPTITDAAHELRISKAAKDLEKRAAVALDRVHDLARAGGERLNSRIADVANLRPTEYAAEIRTAIRGMSASAARDVVSKAVDAGDAATLAALLDAPSVVTGIDPQFAKNMRAAYVEKHAPREYAAQGLLMDTLSLAVKETGRVQAIMKHAANPAGAAKILKQVEAAEKAKADFETA